MIICDQLDSCGDPVGPVALNPVHIVSVQVAQVGLAISDSAGGRWLVAGGFGELLSQILAAHDRDLAAIAQMAFDDADEFDDADGFGVA